MQDGLPEHHFLLPVSAFTRISYAKRRLVISRHPMLTLRILSMKMLKRVDESRHPCLTEPVSCAVIGLGIYIFNETVTCMMLA